ncbi:hypothetical protein I5M27_03625 [Adhaeribacter sp. BT258]|uniref:VCBS repeat-containing protein n=1 Tax=Adhaeribacter terrigena TaxID=2793070 RepID=A0ABS1BYB1_9BACT|nr:hypothetical protein [Adhaeribacter terrigena]MBK0402059.1 hypothetical protein [Adhaeribacter terrigena]
MMVLIIFNIFSIILSLRVEDNGGKPIETIVKDVNQDGIIDTIYLKDKPEDPGLFTTIEIKITGRGVYRFKARDAWDKVDGSFLLNHKNQINSPNAFLTQNSKDVFILLFGFTYGSSRDEFSIIKVSGDKATMILDRDLEKIVAFKDINNDGRMELVCYNEVDRIESFDKQLKAKGGFYVFTIGESATFNPHLSDSYNLKNKRK